MKKYIVKKEAGKSAAIEEFREYSLEELQEYVGGYIEAFNPNIVNKDIFGFCNEEGKINGLVPNFCLKDSKGLTGDIITGNAIFFGGVDKDGNSVGMTLAEAFEVGVAVNILSLIPIDSKDIVVINDVRYVVHG